MRPKLLVIMAALSWSSPLFAQAFLHGDDLLKACRTPDETSEKTTCIAFIVGAVDAFTNARELCLPKDVVGKQVLDIVVNYLISHPETRQNAAASEIDAALKRYHCNNLN